MKKKQNILMLMALFGLIAITAGVTYAFFSYAKQGTTDNTLTTGTITFLYTEVSGVGRGISIDDAYPISDTQGKAQTGEGKVFDFKITSDNSLDAAIPYEVTARKKSGSTLDEAAVKIYLTKVSGDAEEEVLLDKYSKLPQTDKVLSTTHVEKTIYKGKVPSNLSNYEQEFRLRMWIDKDIDFSPDENDNYPYNDKTFTITVNVYANAKVVTDEEIQLENNTNISNITIGNNELTKVENEEYDYQMSLPEGTTETTIDIKTESPDATVKVERLDSLAYSNNIKRLAAKKTLELLPGDNYFKITVISENKKVDDEFILKISVAKKLSDVIFNKYTTIYENATLDKTSEETNENGLYKSTATNTGEPTYYFRGNVENYIDFAGFTWRIVRINEDGTFRLIIQDGINDNTNYRFSYDNTSKDNMYYSNSDTAKSMLEDWYSDKIASNVNYSEKVVSGNYFCEEAKVAYDSDTIVNTGANMIPYGSYTPNFTCEKNGKDGNGKGYVSGSIGLITYDEVAHAGGNYFRSNNSYYLNNNYAWWMMSPADFDGSIARVWRVSSNGNIYCVSEWLTSHLRPVINLKSDITVTGSGTSDSHWIVQ